MNLSFSPSRRNTGSAIRWPNVCKSRHGHVTELPVIRQNRPHFYCHSHCRWDASIARRGFAEVGMQPFRHPKARLGARCLCRGRCTRRRGALPLPGAHIDLYLASPDAPASSTTISRAATTAEPASGGSAAPRPVLPGRPARKPGGESGRAICGRRTRASPCCSFPTNCSCNTRRRS